MRRTTHARNACLPASRRRGLLTAFVAGLAVCATMMGGTASTAVASAGGAGIALPTPTLTPLPITPSSAPFGAMVAGSAPRTVETEYVLRGSARTWNDSGAPSAGTQQYTTRLLVRTPARFGGTVMLELLNASAGFDLEPMWDYQSASLAEHGIAWIGLTYSPASIAFLAGWDPQRYSALNAGLADPSQVWDMVTELGRLIAGDGGRHLLGERGRTAVLTGYSSAACPVSTWTQHFGGQRSPFAGYLVGGCNGYADALSESPGSYTDGSVPAATAAPTVRIDSETDLLPEFAPIRQPDSHNIRSWEVSGGSHIDAQLAARFAAMWSRDLGLPPASSFCVEPLNPLVMGDVWNAAREDLLRWSAGGPPAPAAPRIATSSAGAILRDANGNARGGLRLPTIDAPTGALGPSNVPADSSALAQFCPLVGSFKAFTRAHLRQLYPHHLDYVLRVADSAFSLAVKRFLLPEDAVRLVFEAATSGV